MTTREVTNQALETTGDAAEGVILGSMIAFMGGLAVTYVDLIGNVVYDLASGNQQLLDKVGEFSGKTAAVSAGTVIVSALIGRITDNLRGIRD